ncbi:hypothetical protein [Salegentibacter maritimus]|uniref:hypothetical protein n=1 Tax=Salegentibacter maritimus TaxID=2794347 RepID=UPI0018E41694|nr:hypothetical protein [Salegentibacter maritimus]MBI6117601.1 hypothetical protein [Salegentibacter maritimus]
MKKINNLIILLLTVVCALSCDEDTSLLDTGINPDLYITLPEDVPSIAFPNKPVSFSAKAFAKAGVSKIETKVDYQSLPGSVFTPDDNSKTVDYTFNYTPTNDDLGKTLNYVLVVEDKNGFTSTTDYSVKVELEPAIIEMEFPEILPDTLNVGDVLEFDIKVTSEDELKKIETKLNNEEILELTKVDFDNPFVATYSFSYEIQPEDGGKDITFTYKVTDIEDKFKEENFTLFIKGLAYPKVMKAFADITLGMQGNTDAGQFIDLKTGSVYTVPNAKLMSSGIDLGTFRSGSSGINLFAPSYENAAQFIYNESNWSGDNLGSWSFRNNTELRRISSDLISIDDFDNIMDDRLVIEAFNASEPSYDALTRLEEGEIIAFKTAGGEYGLIHVKAAVSSSSGTLFFDYKIQGDEFIIPINAYSDVEMGMQGNNEVGPFLNVETSTVYSVLEAKVNSAMVDLGTFRSSSSGVNLFVPSYENASQFIYNEANWGSDNLGTWSVRNKTELREVPTSVLTVDMFYEIADGQDVISAFNQSGTSYENFSRLGEDTIIAFKTSNGKHGLLLVKSVTASSTGNIIIDYKVQQ